MKRNVLACLALGLVAAAPAFAQDDGLITTAPRAATAAPRAASSADALLVPIDLDAPLTRTTPAAPLASPPAPSAADAAAQSRRPQLKLAPAPEPEPAPAATAAPPPTVGRAKAAPLCLVSGALVACPPGQSPP